ncbi:MAG: GxxExxY protein [Candidatus Coatesbacteria bacterium]|nr:GxxExxY protein [Candidatus Coatesbacteria bacterium]
MTKPSTERDPRTYAIIGAAMEVHRELGSGFLEAVYQEALAMEFESCGIPFEREANLPIHYKGRQLGAKYKADFICFGEVIVELKALEGIIGQHEAQVLNSLKASGLSVGLVLNFGQHSLQYRRLVSSQSVKSA